MLRNSNNIDFTQFTYIERHLMGATVLHEHPFGELPTQYIGTGLEKDYEPLHLKWVDEYYLHVGSDYPNDWIQKMRSVKTEIKEDVILELLGHINWRPRTMGAYFAMVADMPHLLEIIGSHLLKSEVCFVAKTYLIAIAYFNTPWGMNYLQRYLDHYLGQYHLVFDQREAMETLCYLDQINGTKYLIKYQERWAEFIIHQPHCQKEIGYRRVESEVQIIRKINKKRPLAMFKEWFWLS
jgi:hypothetical protein